MIRYAESLDDIASDALRGFFVGWRAPRTPEEHLKILERSDHVVIAIDGGRVIGFVTALSDGIQTAFIPLLEVLPEYQNCGIGTELVRRMLETLAAIPCVDLTCDPDLQPFYARLGMHPAVGMILRRT